MPCLLGLSKDDFFSDETTFDISYFLRTREGYMPTIAESREDYHQDHLYQMRLREAASDRNRVESSDISDFAYLITGLITIIQSCLVHLILQGVEHTVPTEWSNSHLFHQRQIHADCSTNSQFSKAVHFFLSDKDSVFVQGYFILRWLRNILFWDGSTTFHYLSIIQDLY